MSNSRVRSRAEIGSSVERSSTSSNRSILPATRDTSGKPIVAPPPANECVICRACPDTSPSPRFTISQASRSCSHLPRNDSAYAACNLSISSSKCSAPGSSFAHSAQISARRAESDIGSNGLMITPMAPRLRRWAISFGCPLAVMNTAGVNASAGSSRKRASVVGPSMSGIMTSSSNRSGRYLLASRMASSPDAQASTSKCPTRSIASVATRRISTESSTNRMRSSGFMSGGMSVP